MGETPEGRWLQEVAALVCTAHRQVLAESSRATSQRGAAKTGPSSGGSRTGRGAPKRSAAPLATTGAHDLRLHLNEWRAVEDARVTLERQWETRHEAEAEDQTSSLPVHDRRGSPAHWRSPPKGTARATGYGTGCRAFTSELRWIKWPTKFWPELPEKYDGSMDPVEFLQIYTTLSERPTAVKR